MEMADTEHLDFREYLKGKDGVIKELISRI